MTEEKRENQLPIETPDEPIVEKAEASETPDGSVTSKASEPAVELQASTEEILESSPESPPTVDITSTDSQTESVTVDAPTTGTEATKPDPAITKKRRWRKEKVEKSASEVRWVQIRLFPIWLRVLILLVLIALAAALGAVVGFSIIGDGSAEDVFKKETWQHIFDIMNGKS